MKFDYVIGNPPYQGDNHMQLYPDFYVSGKELADCVEMIFPTGWQEAKSGNNLSKMNNAEVKEDRQIVFIDNIKGAFPNVQGADWTNIILWKKGYNNNLNGMQKILTNSQDEQIVTLAYKKNQVVVTGALKSILDKTLATSFESITDIIFIQNKLNLPVLFKDFAESKSVIGSEGKDARFEKNIFEKLEKYGVFKENAFDDAIRTYGIYDNQRTWKYIDKKYVQLNHENLYQYKVLLSCAAATEEFGSTLSESIIQKPNEAFTRSFISFGAFDTELEAINMSKYLKTKFLRALLYTLKTTRMNNKDVWKNVPLQNFTEKSDINWNCSIKEIDQQLYKKYGLTNEEIEFIETHVKEMA